MKPDTPVWVKGWNIQKQLINNYQNKGVWVLTCVCSYGHKEIPSYFIFITACVQMCVCVSWHTWAFLFFCLYKLCASPPFPAMMTWLEMRGIRIKPPRTESVASSAWLGIHSQTSQIRGNREDINAASKDKWECRGKRCEGKERKSLTQSSFDCSEQTLFYQLWRTHTHSLIHYMTLFQKISADGHKGWTFRAKILLDSHWKNFKLLSLSLSSAQMTE